MFASLRHRNIRLFFGGQLISQIGNWLTILAQALFVYALTGSGLALGLVAAAQFLPLLVLGPWAGVLADRFDKRRLLIAAQAASMLQSFGLAALAFSDSPPMNGLYAIAFVGGIISALDKPARHGFVVELVPDQDVPNAISLNSALMTGSQIVGPALCGLLVTTVGFGWCFLIDGLSYVAVLVGLGAMNPETIRRSPGTPRRPGQIMEGVRYIRSSPRLFIPLVTSAIVGVLALNHTIILQILVLRNMAGSDVDYSLALSVFSVGALVGAMSSARRAEIGLRDVVIATACFGATLVAMAGAPNLAWVFVISALMGIGCTSFLTLITSVLQVHVRADMRGRMLSIRTLVLEGTRPVGGPLVGAGCEFWSARATFLIAGLSVFAATGWAWSATRRLAASPDGAADVWPDPIDV